MDSAITQLRGRCTIAWAWEMLGLPGRPSKHCRSPFRDDLRPSFSVYKAGDGERWFDHGEAKGGDVVDLWARAKGLSVKEALADILSLTAGASNPAKASSRPPEAPKRSDGIRWPGDLREPTPEECQELGALRNLLPEAFWTATLLGTLKVATVYGQKSWLITDSNRRCAEARRFDGRPFMVDGQERKGFCLPGSKKDLPLGLKTTNSHLDALSNILLVEGQPDYFAALALAIDSPVNFRAVAMLGAATSFGLEAKQYLTGKKILIIPHNDIAGQAALPKWVKELYRLGARKVVSQALPIIHDDLNDFLQSPGPDQPFDLLKGSLTDDHPRVHHS